LGATIFEQSRAEAIARHGSTVTVRGAHGAVDAAQVLLASNAYRPLLRRLRAWILPVYDYVLATAPLTAAQLDSIGWSQNQGLTDAGNQFHYFRRTRDDRIVWGGYDAVYHFGRRVDPAYEDRPESYRRLAQHFFLTFPQLDDVRFSHRWAGAIDTNTRFCAHWGLARAGRVAYVNGFTGLGVGAARFAADVCLDLLEGVPTPRTELEMVRRKPMPFPPEPLASIGIQATRWSLDRADHSAGRRNLLLRTLDAVGLGFDS
jgi:glycine/D-amino acid oxidase-like deaminating enzyme